MKLAVIGRNSAELKKKLEHRDVILCEPGDADVILAYGGDGTLLEAEREYPRILKYPIRDVETAPLCHKHAIDGLLDHFFAG